MNLLTVPCWRVLEMLRPPLSAFGATKLPYIVLCFDASKWDAFSGYWDILELFATGDRYRWGSGRGSSTMEASLRPWRPPTAPFVFSMCFSMAAGHHVAFRGDPRGPGERVGPALPSIGAQGRAGVRADMVRGFQRLVT